MNSNNNMIELQMELPIEHEKKVFGQFDEHIKILERSLAVTLISRDLSLIHISEPTRRS